jgi:hypothetical protein
MVDVKRLLGSKLGVAGLFAAAAVLVGTDVVPHDDPAIAGAAGLVSGVVGAGIGLAVQKIGVKLLARFVAPKAGDEAPKA